MADGALSWGGGVVSKPRGNDETDWLPPNWLPRELNEAERGVNMMGGGRADYARALDYCMNFGKFKGRTLKELSCRAVGRNYLRWLYAQKKTKWPAAPNYFERMLKVFMEQSGVGERPEGRRQKAEGGHGNEGKNSQGQRTAPAAAGRTPLR